MKHNETLEYFKEQCYIYKNLFDKKNNVKVLFILVDGLPFRFISNTTSSLKFQKVMNLTYNGSFGLYKSLSSYPTFTLSGMKRLFTGRDASFMDSIFNLGSSIISGDTLFTKLDENKKRILCLGDYLIFSWFPNILTKDSVKTITTTDLQHFEDVDRKTGNYIDYAIKDKYFNWDFLLIYFLGLDQAGHYLNGDKGKMMEKKIDELDEYIFKIYNYMSSKNESYVILISGDHGMTFLGTHGGSEKEEIECGFLISMKNTIFNNSKDTKEINQLDITPTILNFYGIETTKDSIGIVNGFTSNLHEKIYITIVNLKHFILNFQLDEEFLYEAEKCIVLLSDEIKNKCENIDKINIKKILKCEEIVKKLQKPFLTNTPTPNHVIAYSAFILAIIGTCYYLLVEFENLKGLNVIFFITISLLFMGSSFIDEASDVWFFLLQTFLVLQMIHFKNGVKIFMTFKIIFLCSIMHCLKQHVRRRYLIPQINPNNIGEGRWNEMKEKKLFKNDVIFKELLLYHILIRILSITISELSLIIFQNHIMIWSTFAPKYIIDIALFIITFIIHLFLTFIS